MAAQVVAGGDQKVDADLAGRMSAASISPGGAGAAASSSSSAAADRRAALRRQESTHREIEKCDEVATLKQRTRDHDGAEAKDLGDGNTTSLVGGLTLTDADSRSQDRKKFFHGSVQEGVEVVADDQDKFSIFMRWLRDNGAKMPGLYLKKYTDDVRGVHADREIASSSQIVTIPLKLLIHEGMGQQTTVGGRVHADPTCHIIVPAHTQVIIYILENLNNPDCFFKPYFDILPATFNR